MRVFDLEQLLEVLEEIIEIVRNDLVVRLLCKSCLKHALHLSWRGTAQQAHIRAGHVRRVDSCPIHITHVNA